MQNRGYTQLITVGQCPRCRGAGRRILERCPVCEGSGHLRTSEKIELTVPPGMEDGSVLRVSGHGLPASGRGPPGDLYVQVVFEPLDHIRREGEDAYTETNVPLGVALLGGEVTVQTIEGHAVLKIPPGTQPETQFRLRGNGFPRFRGSSRGDLIVTAHVEVPRSLSGHEKDLLREALLPGGRPIGARKDSNLPTAEPVTPDETDPAVLPDQYFTPRPRSPSVRSELRFLYRGDLLHFLVDRGVFASHGLDPGTALLIENLTLERSDRVLDLGCGWGPVGVAAARTASEGHVVMTEVNRRAARLARLNLERNRIENAEVRVGPTFEPVAGESFDVIASNPPYRAGRPVVLQILQQAPQYLTPAGRLVIVGKGSQGIRVLPGVARLPLGGTGRGPRAGLGLPGARGPAGAEEPPPVKPEDVEGVLPDLPAPELATAGGARAEYDRDLHDRSRAALHEDLEADLVADRSERAPGEDRPSERKEPAHRVVHGDERPRKQGSGRGDHPSAAGEAWGATAGDPATSQGELGPTVLHRPNERGHGGRWMAPVRVHHHQDVPVGGGNPGLDGRGEPQLGGSLDHLGRHRRLQRAGQGRGPVRRAVVHHHQLRGERPHGFGQGRIQLLEGRTLIKRRQDDRDQRAVRHDRERGSHLPNSLGRAVGRRPRVPPTRRATLGSGGGEEILPEALKKGGLLGARTLGRRGLPAAARHPGPRIRTPRGVSSAPKESKETKAEPAAPAPPTGAEPSAEKAPKKEKPGQGPGL